MGKHKVNTFVADAYREACARAQDLVDTGLPKARINVAMVQQGGDLALTATVESPGPYPQDDIGVWLDCVRGEVSVNWICEPET